MIVPPRAVQAQFSVSALGAPNYSQAISVPPGPAGMSPKLAIYYAGGGVNGPLGHGWSVQGVSTITRCPGSIAIDGTKSGVQYGPNDKLCLDGQRLVQTDVIGTPLLNGAGFPVGNDVAGQAAGAFLEYRTEKDIYARIRAYGFANGDSTGASGPQYFRVWTKAGQIYDYGDAPSRDANTKALISAVGTTVATVWAVGRIRDTLGNYIDFKYDFVDSSWGSGPTAGSPTAGREWRIREIDYGGNTATGTAASNRVVFSYAARTGSTQPQDAAEAYHLGRKNVSVFRLQSITTYVNAPYQGALFQQGASPGVAVKTLQLVYDLGPVSGRSRLKSIKECAGDVGSTRCLPPTTFNYAPGGNDSYVANSVFASGPLATLSMASTSGDVGVLLGDFFGDGRTGFIRWSNDPSQNQLYRSNGDGSFQQIPNGTGPGQFNITSQNLFKSDGCFLSMVADFNGDGLPDILRYSNATNPSGTVCANSGPPLLYLNNGDGSFTQKNISGVSLSRIRSRRTTNCLVAPNPDGSCSEPGDQFGWTSGNTFYLMDVDGDGKLDIVFAFIQPAANSTNPVDVCSTSICTQVFKGDGQGNFIQSSTNLSNQNVYSLPDAGYTIGSPTQVGDIDGDGLADLIAVGNPWLGQKQSWRSLGNGNFATGLAASQCAYPIDFNGDGRLDCLQAGVGAGNNALRVSDGTGSMVNVAGFNLVNAGQELASSGTGPGSGVGFIVADINGDGRQDILRWKDDPSQNTAYSSNGDGTFSTSTTFNLGGASAVQLQKSDGTAAFLTGDFTGRGATEILRIVVPVPGSIAGNQLYLKIDATPPDQLASVTTGTGATTTAYYVPLGSPTPQNGISADLGPRYTTDRRTSDAAVFPTIDIVFPGYVVATTQMDSGVGSARNNVEYRYSGLKADINGRGLLGFREIRRQMVGANGSPMTVDTQYLLTQPYIGVALRSDTYNAALSAVSSSNLISSAVNLYCDKTAAAGADTTALSTGVSCPIPTNARRQRPYLLRSIESGKDIDPAGTTLPTVTTQNTFNNSGDLTQIAVTTALPGSPASFTKTTANTYQPDDTSCSDLATCNWIRGRLTQATVSSSVPNLLAGLTPSAGTGSNATATTGNGPLQVGVLSGISFGNVAIGANSTLTATLANTGAAALTVTVPTAASVTGADFSFDSTTCTTQLAVGASCTVSVKFAPTASGTRNGTLTVSTGGGLLGSPLTGVGGAGSQGGTLSNINFGGVAVNQSSTLTSTLQNTGSSALSITVPTASSVTGTDFSFVATTCTASLGVGAACTVSVRFAPTAAVVRSGSLAVATGAGTLTAQLFGTGVAGPTLTAISFGSVAVNTTQTKTSTLTNNGTGAVSVTVPTASSVTGTGFSFVSTTCSSSLAASASCTISVQFAPTSQTTFNGTLSVGTGAGTVSAALTGTGSPGQGGTLSGLSFGNVNINTSSAANSTLTNTGSIPLSVTPPTAGTVIGAGFSVLSTTCGTSLAVGAACTVSVQFLPISVGAASAFLTIATGAGNLSANLSGTGLLPAPTPIAFGNVTVNTSLTLSSTLANNGTGALSVTVPTAGSVSGARFSFVSTNCPATLAAGASCSINVQFLPTTQATFNGTLTVTTASGTVSAALTGTGVPNQQGATLSSVSFGNVNLNSSSTMNSTLSNTGPVTLNVTPPGAGSVSGTGFSFVSTNCPSALASGTGCTIAIRFLPTAAGVASGTLSISTGAGPLAATLSGTGVLPSLSSIAFGNVNVGSSVTKTSTLTNIGSAPLSVTVPTAGSVTGTDFSFVSTPCSTSLNAGSSCNISVQFAPTAGVARSGQLAVATGAGTVMASLSGTGVVSGATVSGSPGTLAFGTILKGAVSNPLSVTLTNSSGVAATGLVYTIAYTSGTIGNGVYALTGGTCPMGGGPLAANSSCTLALDFQAGCTGGSRNGTLTTSGSNFTSVVTTLTATTSSAGSCQ